MSTHELGELLLASDNIDVCIPVPGFETTIQEVLKFTIVEDDVCNPDSRFLIL